MIINPELDTYFYSISKIPYQKTPTTNVSKPDTGLEILTFGNDLNDKFLQSANPKGFTDNAVLSLSIDEEEFAMMTINLQVADFYNLHYKSFLNGQRWLIKWGVKKNFSVLGNILNLDTKQIGIDKATEFHRGGEQGILCFVTSSTHSIVNNTLIWNVSLRGSNPQSNGRDSKVYKNNETLKDIVFNTCLQMIPKLKPANFFFEVNASKLHPERQLIATSKNTITRNYETPMEFVRRLALKNNCKFTLFYKGVEQCVLFCGWESEKNLNTNIKRGGKGVYHRFDIGNVDSNIITCDGVLNTGSNGSVAFPVTNPDGTTGLQFAAGEKQSTSGYDINTKAVKESGLVNNVEWQKFQANLQLEDFKDENGNFKTVNFGGKPIYLGKFFIPVTVTTAPESWGHEYNIECVPNPLYQIGDFVWLGNIDKEQKSLIPDNFKTKVNEKNGATSYWRIAKINWTHSSSGVSQKVTLKR